MFSAKTSPARRKICFDALDCDERPLDYLALVFLHENCVAALDSENWKEKMQEQLFPVKPDFVWTGRRELAYLKMMEAIAEDIEDVAQPGPGEELLIQITSNWDFEFGSSLSGVNRNNFAGDTLNFDLTGWAGDQWEVMSGSASAFSGWNDASRVTLGGESAAWDSDISGWCSSNYQLTLEEDGDGRKLIIAGKLA